MASGLDFPDALAGATVAGAQGAPVLLTDPDELAGAALASAQGSVVLLSDPQDLPDSTVDALADADPMRLVLLGGSAALSTSVAREATVHLE